MSDVSKWSASPEGQPAIPSAAQGSDGNCLSLVFDRAVMEGILPDGRKVADVLPADGVVRKIEGTCSRATCDVVGFVLCHGNVALRSSDEGVCDRSATREPFADLDL